MHTARRRFAIIASTTLAAATLALPASAKTIAGYSGKALWFGDQTCFQDASGSAAQLWCTGANRGYVIHPQDVLSGASVNVNVGTQAYQTMTCNINEYDSSGNVLLAHPNRTSFVYGTPQNQSMFLATASSSTSSKEAQCSVPPNARVNSLTW